MGCGMRVVPLFGMDVVHGVYGTTPASNAAHHAAMLVRACQLSSPTYGSVYQRGAVRAVMCLQLCAWGWR